MSALSVVQSIAAGELAPLLPICVANGPCGGSAIGSSNPHGELRFG